MLYILHTYNFYLKKKRRVPWGFPCSSAGKESTCNAGDPGSIPGLGRSPGEGIGYPLQYSGLEDSMDCISMGLQRVRHDWVTFTSHGQTEPRLGSPTSQAGELRPWEGLPSPLCSHSLLRLCWLILMWCCWQHLVALWWLFPPPISCWHTNALVRKIFSFFYYIILRLNHIFLCLKNKLLCGFPSSCCSSKDILELSLTGTSCLSLLLPSDYFRGLRVGGCWAPPSASHHTLHPEISYPSCFYSEKKVSPRLAEETDIQRG